MLDGLKNSGQRREVRGYESILKKSGGGMKIFLFLGGGGGGPKIFLKFLGGTKTFSKLLRRIHDFNYSIENKSTSRK